MGNWYINAVVKDKSRELIAAYLRQTKWRSAVLPSAGRYTTVGLEFEDFPEPHSLPDWSARLSKELSCPLLTTVNVSDDMLYFYLCDRGRLAAEYFSSDAYEVAPQLPSTGNNNQIAKALCDFTEGGDVAAVEKILSSHGKYLFAVELHLELAEAMRLRAPSIGVGYKYATKGELPEGVKLEDLILTP